MTHYTVVLLRPEYLGEETEEEYGQDIYVAAVEADCCRSALKAAQDEVMTGDWQDGLEPKQAVDYKLCVMFEGHHYPILFGWQS